MNDNLKISQQGLEFIANWEGCLLKPYMDIASLWTIGVGHLILPSDIFSTIANDQIKSLLASKDKNHPVAKISIPKQEALDILSVDVKKCEDAIKANITVPLTQNQFDALCSFGFNCGTGVYKNSGVANSLKASQYNQVPVKLLDWSKARVNGELKTVQGLYNRRKSEGELFARPDSQTIDAIVSWNKETLMKAQAKLQKLGLYALKVDGIWGPGTERAVTAFSSQCGVPVSNPLKGVPAKLLEALESV